VGHIREHHLQLVPAVPQRPVHLVLYSTETHVHVVPLHQEREANLCGLEQVWITTATIKQQSVPLQILD
jgi:hypothetical protein